jgi:chromosomal replication initiation ATPase DnaA
VRFGLHLLHPDIDVSRQRYWSLMAMAMPHAHLIRLPVANRNDPRVIGSDRFLQQLFVPNLAHVSRTISEIAREVCEEFSLEWATLHSTDSDRAVVRARGLVAARVVRESAGTLAELARYFNRSPSAIARAIQRHG